MATKTLTSPNDPDPELIYYVGAILAFCGKKDAAMHLLRTAIESNYCSYSQLHSDPLLAKLRLMPEFNQLLAAAQNASRPFLKPERRRAPDPANPA
jgi:hypothetical protein